MNLRVSYAAILLAFAPFMAHAADRKDAELAITQASTAVEAAQRADAPQYANVEIKTAQDMLAGAQAAYDHHAWLDSVLNADNATADANLATARSRQHRAESATAEIAVTVRSLREQLGIPGEQQ